MKISKRLLAMLLTVVMVGTFFIGCEQRIPDAESSSESSSASSKKPKDESLSIAASIESRKEEILQKQEDNSDSVGWLNIPILGIEDVVLWSDVDNQYYKRRNLFKEREFDGVYYQDYRAKLHGPDSDKSVGYDGSVEKLPLNTVIYGHALTDNPESEQYKTKFAPLHNLRDPEYATEVPYIYYSTDTEDLVFEVFALLVVNSDNGDVPYNHPNKDPQEFYDMIQKEILPRSVLDYDVTLNPDDKYITLSTCIYHLPGHEEEQAMAYPNYFRYAVMGRLVTDTSQPIKETVGVSVNKDIILDPNTPMSSVK